MKKWKLLLLAVALLLAPIAVVHNLRSVRPFLSEPSAPSKDFDRAQSAALFVGIRNFTHDKSLTSVRFAADDAVDLAHAIALDPNAVNLVPPDRVVIALSGLPHKAKSKQRQKELKAAGAQVSVQADPSDLLMLLRQQARLAGRDGLFVVSFATHGFSLEGVPYLLGASSFFEDVETTLSALKVMEIVDRSDAARSLIFLDACREYVRADSRSGVPEPLSAAPLISAMRNIEGQVVFYAADTGGYAYDNPKRENGVFTAAVIDGLQCRAGKKRNMVTVGTLARYVEKNVLKYVRQYRNPEARKATQISMEGSTDMMPLALCKAPTPLMPQPLLTPSSPKAVVTGSTLTVFDSAGKQLWTVGAENFQLGSAFRKGTREIVAVKDDRIFLFTEDGTFISVYQHDSPVSQVDFVRETSHRAPRIIASARSSRHASSLHVKGPVATVFMVDPKRMSDEPLWYGAIVPATEAITRFELADHDRNEQRDIAITTSTGNVLHLDFDGHTIAVEPGGGGIARFQLLATK
jgi:hypothetical protein